jgi:hypothetical protein
MFSSIKSGARHLHNAASKLLWGDKSRCDDTSSGSTILEAADEELEGMKPKVQTPIQFDIFRMIMAPTRGHNYFDGFRMGVSKPLNMNSQVSHQYILGSQQMGGANIYQYRAFYGTEDTTLQVGSDMDFNSDGYFRKQLWPKGALVSKWAFQDQGNNFEAIYEGSDNESSYTVSYAPYSTTFTTSFMQSVTPSLTMGGMMSYVSDKKKLSKAVGVMYEGGEDTVGALYDEDSSIALMYTRRVNPNRVHLSTELKVAPDGQTAMACGAEYMLRQAKLQMSFDSNMALKSSLETTAMPGVKIQLSAEINHGSDEFKCGYGLQLGD